MKCKHCGIEWSEHHDFEPVIPARCQCDPIAWGLDGEEIPPVCKEFQRDMYSCFVCDHPEGCHSERE